MADDCCNNACAAQQTISPRYRRVLWMALCINAIMFAVEIAGSIHSGSVSLLADAVDFLGDAANYGLSLAVLSMGLVWRARAALVKGLTMGAYGIFVIVKGFSAFLAGVPPEPVSMGFIAVVALLANVSVAAMLFAYREGDANMRSVWLCSRNDALGNAAVILAAVGVFGTNSAWPDLLVAGVMATLALTAAGSVVRQSLGELSTVVASR